MKQITPDLRELIQRLLLLLAVAFLLFAVLFTQVWKAGEGQRYAVKRALAQKKLEALQSECAGLQVSVQQLSNTKRLMAYAVDTLGLVPPRTDQVVVVRRSASGKLVEEKKGFLSRLKGWFQ